MIKIKSATRVDLAGGTLDMWPLYNFIGGALTINLAISINTYATLTPTVQLLSSVQNKSFYYEMNEMYPFHTDEWTRLKDQAKRESLYILDFTDVQYFKVFYSLDEIYKSQDKELNYIKPLLKHFKPSPFYLKLKSESPVGGGLGGSSSLMISMLKAFYKWQGIIIDSSDMLVHLAHNLESQILRTPTGTQDYYPAVTGGLHFLNYQADGIISENISLKEIPLENNITVVYTGRSHHSGLNNFEVLKAAVEGDDVVLSALSEINKISKKMKEVLISKSWSELPELFNFEREQRLRLTSHFSSPEIESLIKLCDQKKLGSLKICGAGGGGCVFIWHDQDLRSKVKLEVENLGLKVLMASPVDIF